MAKHSTVKAGRVNTTKVSLQRRLPKNKLVIFNTFLILGLYVIMLKDWLF